MPESVLMILPGLLLWRGRFARCPLDAMSCPVLQKTDLFHLPAFVAPSISGKPFHFCTESKPPFFHHKKANSWLEFNHKSLSPSYFPLIETILSLSKQYLMPDMGKPTSYINACYLSRSIRERKGERERERARVCVVFTGSVKGKGLIIQLKGYWIAKLRNQ